MDITMALSTKIDKDFDSLEGALAKLAKHLREAGGSGEFDKAQFIRDRTGKFFADFNTILKEYNKSSEDPEGIPGDRLLEKYKAGVTKSWKHQPEKPDAVKPITKEELDRGTSDFAARSAAIAARRDAERQRTIEGPTRLAITAGSDVPVTIDESSEEDDIEILDRIVRGDPNPGKGESDKIKQRFEAEIERRKARAQQSQSVKSSVKIEEIDEVDGVDEVDEEIDLKHRKTKVIKRKSKSKKHVSESESSSGSESSSDSESDSKGKSAKGSKGKSVKESKGTKGKSKTKTKGKLTDQDKEMAAELAKLDDIHNMQKLILEEDSD